MPTEQVLKQEDGSLTLKPLEFRFLSVGDHVSDTGNVTSFRLNESGFRIDPVPSPVDRSEADLERRTYLLVNLRRDDHATPPFSQYRLMFENAKHEDLGVAMAMVVSIKDALLHGKKARLHGVVEQHRIGGGGTIPPSEPYRRLKSVEILA